MYERVPPEEYPNVPINPDVPLAYLHDADERDGDSIPKYIFDTPDLANRYVVRPMGFSCSWDGVMETVSLRHQHERYVQELARLRKANVAIPHVFIGLPENYETIVPTGPWDYDYPDIMLVAEMIDPLSGSEMDFDLAKVQARQVIDGLVEYLQTTKGLYLYDVFTYRQFVYGTPTGRYDLNYYMVDIGADFKRTRTPSYMDQAAFMILDSATLFGEEVDDPELYDYAHGLLFDSIHLMNSRNRENRV